MTSPKQFNRISELLCLLADGVITAEQCDELDKAVVGNSDAEEFCVDWLMNIDSLQRFGSVFFESAQQVEDTIIRDYLPSPLDNEPLTVLAEIPGGFDTDMWEALSRSELTAEPVDVEPAPVVVARPTELVTAVPASPRKISKLSIYAFAVSAAALLFIMAIALLTSPSLPIVAVLDDSINASWSGTAAEIEGGQLQYGAGLRPGSLALMGGVSKIIMLDGAEVVLKGPVVIELETAGRLKLTHGRLFAKVPKGAEGFTVHTDSATVVDYGTEFGVAIDDQGRTETHVFQGMVKLSAGNNNPDPSDAMELSAGQACTVEAGDIKQVDFHRHAFTSYVPTAYEIAVKKKNPMSYWRLKPGSAQSLINLADKSSVEVKYTGVVDLVDGPFPGHSDVCSAVKFYGNNSYLYIPQVDVREKTFGSKEKPKYTFMLWVRPDAISNQVITSRSNKKGIFHRVVGMTEDGRFNYIYWDNKNSKALFSLEADSFAQAGQWYHVAVSIDKKGDARLFVNGRPEGSAVKISNLSNFYPARFVGQRYVGSLPEDVNVKGYESLNGAVADIVEYDRLLPAREIRSLYLSASNQ